MHAEKKKKSNLHYTGTRRIAGKRSAQRVGKRGPSPRLSTWAAQLRRKRRSGGEPLATLRPIRDLNPKPLAPIAMS